MSPPEDDCITTCHIRKFVENFFDIAPMDDIARDDFSSRLFNWWEIIKGHVHESLTFREARYYDVPATQGLPMGDPVHVETFGSNGTSQGALLPPQCAVSVTYKTDKRLQWGRQYLPGFTLIATNGLGRLDVQSCDEVMNASKLLTSRSGSGGCLVVFSRKQWTHHDPQFVQVDDVIDVIRSRRYETTMNRSIISAG